MEYRTVEHLKKQGYEAFRVAKGQEFDVMAYNGNVMYLIEVKGTKRKPTPSTYKPFVGLYCPPFAIKMVYWWAPHSRQPETWKVD
jgi:hypothetical protein